MEVKRGVEAGRVLREWSNKGRCGREDGKETGSKMVKRRGLGEEEEGDQGGRKG